MKIIWFLIACPLSYAMDPTRDSLEQEKLKNACISKKITEKTEEYSTKITDEDGSTEYAATEFLHPDKQGFQRTCTRTRIGKFGSEVSETLDEKWFEFLKDIYEKQREKK